MDHISKVARADRRRGMSYGKYVALVREGLMPPVPRDESESWQDRQNMKTCAYCGEEFSVLDRGGHKAKYCSDECYRAMNNRRSREKYKKVGRQRKPKAEKPAKPTTAVCATCGKKFSLEGKHHAVRYCSEECRKSADNRRAKEAYEQAKAEGRTRRKPKFGACLFCGARMQITQKTKKYCSLECARGANLAKVKQWKKDHKAKAGEEQEEC